jgi:hypothetical protein
MLVMGENPEDVTKLVAKAKLTLEIAVKAPLPARRASSPEAERTKP